MAIRRSVATVVAAFALASAAGSSDASASTNVLYESFGADGVSALDLADPGFAVGFLGASATNIVAGGARSILRTAPPFTRPAPT
jgi:hypothetical protein